MREATLLILTLLAASQGLPAAVKVADDPELVVRLDGNGYRDVVVALRDNLDEKDCKMFVDAIQDMMRETSQMLHQATRGKLYFAEVTVLLPATWTCADVPSDSTTFTNNWHTAHLRIAPAHPVFGDNLWTQQPRGCGQGGDFIFIPEEWLNSYLSGEGISVKELVGQWARYRWGVFGEEGYQGDDIHPPVFLTQHNASTVSLKPTLCHNGDLQGSFSGSCDNPDDTTGCLFTVDPEGSTNVTSSLLSLPSLSSVVEFCDEDTHDSEAPTKQNLMCGGRSAWEVMSQHSDLDGREEWQGSVEPTFRVVRAERSSQPLHPNIVIVMEYTNTMAETLSRWKFLHDAVTKFILLEAPQGMKVGLVSLTDTATTLAGLTTLRDFTSRQSLASLVPQDPPTKDAIKNLEAGITEAATMLGDDGVVVMLVESLDNHTGETFETLEAAAGNASLHFILYPHLPSVDISLYEELANTTEGSVLPVVNPYGPEYQIVDDVVALNQHFRTILQDTMIDDTEWKHWKKEAGGVCSANCSLPLHLPQGSEYQSEIVLELSFLSFDAAGLTSVDMSTPDGTILTPSGTLEQETLRHYFYTQTQHWETGNYTVWIERQSYVDDVVVSLQVRYRPLPTHVIWASEPLLDLQQSTTSPPTLFVQVWEGLNYMAGATLEATFAVSENEYVLNLNDDGTRGDVTGGDGVYSGVITGVSGETIMHVFGDSLDGTALLVGSQSLHTFNNLNQTQPIKCCGSSLDLTQVRTEEAGQVSFNDSVTINVRGAVIPDPPPSKVTDVKVLIVQRSTSDVALQFTASGEDFYNGEASSYEVTTQSLASNETVVEVVTAPPATPNSLVTLQLQENTTECDVVQVFTVRAVDAGGQMSEASNQPKKFIPCESTITTDTSPPSTTGSDSSLTSTSPSSTDSSTPSTDDSNPTSTPSSTSSTPSTDGSNPASTPSSTSSTPVPTSTPSSTPSTLSTDGSNPTSTPLSTPSTSSTDGSVPTSTHPNTPSPLPTDHTKTTSQPPPFTTDVSSSTNSPAATTTTTTTETPTQPDDDNSNLGAILGGVLGGLVGLVALGFVGKLIYTKVAAKKAADTMLITE